MTPIHQNQPEPDDKIIGHIKKSPSARIETEHHIIHRSPRISATKLGEYLVTDPSKQKTIIKNQKKAQKAIVLHHRKTKLAFLKSFGATGFNRDYLLEKSLAISVEKSETDWQKLDNDISADALKKLADIAGGLKLKDAVKIARPSNGWGGLELNGVKISIQPTVVFSLQHKNTTKVGAVILYCTKDDSRSLAKELNGNCAGDYVGALLLKMLEQKLSAVGVPLPSMCVTIDVFRGKIHSAPTRFKTLLKHAEDACEIISLRWDGIEI